jgi:hypothetical protein
MQAASLMSTTLEIKSSSKEELKTKLKPPYKAPGQIMQVNNNGTIHITVNSVKDTYNIRRLIPYNSENGINHGGECNMRTSNKKRRKHKQQSVTQD